jgi:hypothetical protein
MQGQHFDFKLNRKLFLGSHVVKAWVTCLVSRDLGKVVGHGALAPRRKSLLRLARVADIQKNIADSATSAESAIIASKIGGAR